MLLCIAALCVIVIFFMFAIFRILKNDKEVKAIDTVLSGREIKLARDILPKY